MEPKFNTSFIPKRSLAKTTKEHRRRGGGSISIVPFITLILFLGALGLTMGVFLYDQFLIQNLNQKKEALVDAREALDSPLIDEMERLDSRIKSAKLILNNHVILTGLFDLLEQQTLTNVRFTDFSYEIFEGATIDLTMRGTARSFNAIAVQSEIFDRDRLIQNPIFSGLNVDESGNVIFNFTASIDPRLLSYTLTFEASDFEKINQDEG